MAALLVFALLAIADNPKVAALAESAEKVGYRDYAALVRENVRAKRTLEGLMDADELTTANDFFTASGLVSNAPGYESRLLAHEWAMSALALGHPDAVKRVQRTWDYLQLDGGHPQRFGSITRRDAKGVSVPRETDPTLASLTPASGTDNAELKALMDADQADRKDGADWDEVPARDAVRRARVLAILKEGKATTGPDEYNAALVLQHGDGYGDFELAHELCLGAIARGYKRAAWLVSRTYDRMLQNGGHAQRFGTQSQQAAGSDVAYVVEADYPGPSDTVRKLFNAPTRADTRKALDAWLKTIGR